MIKIQVMLSCNFVLFATTISSIKEINYYLDMNQFCIILSKLSINQVISRYFLEDWIKNTMSRFVRKYLFQILFIYFHIHYINLSRFQIDSSRQVLRLWECCVSWRLYITNLLVRFWQLDTNLKFKCPNAIENIKIQSILW